MQRNVFRIALSVAVLALVVAPAFGAGGGEEEADTQPDTQAVDRPDSWIGDYTFTMLYRENPAIPYAEGKSLLIEEAERLTGVSVQVDAVPNSDYNTKAGVLLNSGDAPDFIPMFDSLYDQFVDTGVLLRVSEYEDQLPLMMDAISRYQAEDDLDRMREVDGSYSFFPELLEEPIPYYGLMIRQDLVDKYDLEAPRTTDEWLSLLIEVQENEPDLLGFGMRNQYGNVMHAFGALFGVKAGWHYGNGFAYNEETDSWYFSPTTDRYRGMVSFLHEMMAAGVFDPESFTQSITQFNTKAAQGKYSAIINWIVPEGDTHEWMWVTPVQTEFDVKPRIPIQETHLRYLTVVPAEVSRRDNFDDFLEFLDWFFYSDKAIEIGNWGIEGLTFEMVDGDYRYLPEVQTKQSPEGSIIPEEYMGIHENSLTQVKLFDAEVQLTTAANKAEYFRKIIEGGYLTQQEPVIRLTTEDRDVESMYEENVQSYVEEMTLKFIMGDASIEDGWANFVEQCNAKGVPELTELYNAAYRRGR